MENGRKNVNDDDDDDDDVCMFHIIQPRGCYATMSNPEIVHHTIPSFAVSR